MHYVAGIVRGAKDRVTNKTQKQSLPSMGFQSGKENAAIKPLNKQTDMWY